ncbi:MAG: hypothetical protein SPE04_10040 [Prevotella sp.]|nr:hypothetical protein [Prevotella sp. P2-180]MDY4499889.1 hypothetical protein [Prevotella sp.]
MVSLRITKVVHDETDLPCCQGLGLLVWLTYFLQGGNEVGTVGGLT